MEELLPLLPQQFRSRYVLVYSSRSLQGASAKFPRVIMFGLDAKFIIAFSGDLKQHGYDLLETIEFSDQTKKFQFRSITFPAEQETGKQTGTPAISEQNPQRCKTCHMESLRPNWDTYSAWPGIYGSVNDAMPASEKEKFESFKVETFMKTGRYRFFEDPDHHPDVSGYYDYYRWGRPNLQFTFLLSLLNSQAIARRIQENARLRPYRYALLAATNCSVDFGDPESLAHYIPRAKSKDFQQSYSQISMDVSKSILASHKVREERQRTLLEWMGAPSKINEWEVRFKPKESEFASSTSRLRYVLELAGVAFPKEWSMEFGSNNYVFYAGTVGEVGELGLFLWQELLDPIADRRLYELYSEAWSNRTGFGNMIFSTGTEELCRDLGKNSLEALASE